MQRTEAGVVKRTVEVLEECEKSLDVLSDQPIAEQLMIKLLLKELREIINPFATSQAVATQAKLKPLEDFLRKCNRLLLATPLLYCYQPTGLISKPCIALAEDLASIFPYSSLKLLLPKVIIPEDFHTQHYNNFIVTSDGYLVGILEGLDAVRARSDHRFLKPSGSDLDPDLLMEHSASAATYAMKIRNLFRPKEKDLAECDKLRSELKQYIDDTPHYKRLKPAHKEAGRNKLMAMLIKKISTPDQLAEFMDENLLKDEWLTFLRAIERDELCRIMIPKRNQSVQKRDQSDKDYKDEQATLAYPAATELAGSVVDWPDSDNAKRILVFNLVFLCDELRKDGPEVYSWGGSALSYISYRATTKTDVLIQTKAMQDFLLSNDEKYRDMRDVEKYFADNKMVFSSTTCLNLKAKIIDAGRQCEHALEEKQASVATLK